MQVTKTEAAERQLRQAIYLFFERKDPVSIHTLVGAAHEVLHGLAKREGKTSILKDYANIRPEKRCERIRVLNAAPNFFKHADRDPDEILEFCPESTKFLLYDAVEMYFHITETLFKEAFVFRIWFFGRHREIIEDDRLRALFDLFTLQLGGDFDNFEGLLAAMECFELPENWPHIGT